jgi:hypothetical protein
MSDDGTTDDGGDGFLGWLWNTFLGLFSGDGSDDAADDGTIAGQPTQTNSSQRNATDGGTTQTVNVAPVNVTTTTAGADAGSTATSPPAGTTIPNREFGEEVDVELLDELTIQR